MMITIHGFPAKTKYQDVKILIKQECNINDFILDNLINDTDGTKKVRIGLTDNTEGYKVMKCLDGYRMPGNFVLKAVPVGKSALGGRKRYIPPDETLDRVAALLGASRTGIKVELDDNSESDNPVSDETQEAPPSSNDPLSSSLIAETSNSGNLTPSFMTESSNSETLASRFNAEPSNSTTIQNFTYTEPETPLQRIELCVMNDAEENLLENSTQECSENKIRTLDEVEQQSRINKNEALAAYFQAKAEKVQLENEKLKLEIELLKSNRTANGFNS